MQSLKDALNLLEEVEKIISNYNPSEEDKKILNDIITKNMKIEAELYSKYINMR
ncbi:hypothetical protein [Acidianus brierleyi]|uniref:hypothetical protein n=1 Tax=Acidianus brierleyi TaxID=41673 RepID=UPI00144386BF|nr:hypothetical protein [Acidianus brierleyi]